MNEHKEHVAQLKKERVDSINDRNKILQEMNQLANLSQKISDTSGTSELRRLKKRIDQLDRNIKDNDKNIRNWNSKRRASNNANTDKIIEELNTQIKRYEKEKDEKNKIYNKLLIASGNRDIKEILKEQKLNLKDILNKNHRVIEEKERNIEGLRTQISEIYVKIKEQHDKLLGIQQDQATDNNSALLHSERDISPKAVSENPINVNSESKIEYIVQNLFTMDSAFALSFVMLFPISILAIGFVLARKEGEKEATATSFNIEKILENGSMLTNELQVGFTEMLKPSIMTYISGLKLSNDSNVSSMELNAVYDKAIQVTQALFIIRAQINNSKLSADAKSSLESYINNLIQEQEYSIRKNYNGDKQVTN
ncbi:MAG: hypothetical protein R2568_08825 [Candidatus Scalindua sp.]|nr:hypothetical protein [Candidatus Scalindua sp.]MDV5166836.1 hypothetical protein [Candidatus Scalindua sp.]